MSAAVAAAVFSRSKVLSVKKKEDRLGYKVVVRDPASGEKLKFDAIEVGDTVSLRWEFDTGYYIDVLPSERNHPLFEKIKAAIEEG